MRAAPAGPTCRVTTALRDEHNLTGCESLVDCEQRLGRICECVACSDDRTKPPALDMWLDRPPLGLHTPEVLVSVPADADRGYIVQHQTIDLDRGYRAFRKAENEDSTVCLERPQGVGKTLTTNGVNDNVHAAEGFYGLAESIGQHILVSACGNSN